MTGQRGNRAQTSLLSPTKRHPGKLGKAVMSFAAALARAQHQALEETKIVMVQPVAPPPPSFRPPLLAACGNAPLSCAHCTVHTHVHKGWRSSISCMYVCTSCSSCHHSRPPTNRHVRGTASSLVTRPVTASPPSVHPLGPRGPEAPEPWPFPQSCKLLCATHRHRQTTCAKNGSARVAHSCGDE